MSTPADHNAVPAEGPDQERNGTHVARDEDVDRGGQVVSRSKFDLGERRPELPTENIPWGYGEARITAMARDPDWLYVYWELTDESIAAARQALGMEGADAWLSLRVYDTTGRVFDGANALDWFDIAIERGSRDWFIHIARPGTAAHVDVGLKTLSESFRTIVRSGRADFPRKRPSTDTTLQWLSVTPASNLPASPTVAPYRSAFAGEVPQLDGAAPSEQPMTPPPAPPSAPPSTRRVEDREVAVFWKTVWQERRLIPWSMTVSHRHETSYQRVSAPWFTSTWRTEWQGDRKSFDWFTPLHGFAWAGSLPRFEWIEGPQTTPWAERSRIEWIEGPMPSDPFAEARVIMHLVGPPELLAQWGGEDAFVEGPWHVVIQGFAPAEPRRVLDTWVMHWARPAIQRHERWLSAPYRTWLAALERGGITLGASESQHWAEQTLTELWTVGASELLWLGASELLSIGASELAFLGASGWSFGAGSEVLSAWRRVQLGASEQWLMGASERWMLGASEQWLMGASEVFALGASEQRLGGSEERFAAGSSEVWAIGASEQWASGVHELAGASEQTVLTERSGASEQWVLGASEGVQRRLETREQWMPGASEQVARPIEGAGPALSESGLGASELLLGGASEQDPQSGDRGSKGGA